MHRKSKRSSSRRKRSKSGKRRRSFEFRSVRGFANGDPRIPKEGGGYSPLGRSANRINLFPNAENQHSVLRIEKVPLHMDPSFKKTVEPEEIISSLVQKLNSNTTSMNKVILLGDVLVDDLQPKISKYFDLHYIQIDDNFQILEVKDFLKWLRTPYLDPSPVHAEVLPPAEHLRVPKKDLAEALKQHVSKDT